MAKPEQPAPPPSDPADEPLGESPYDPPTELDGAAGMTSDEEELSLAGTPPERPDPRRVRPGALKAAIVFGVVLAIGTALLVYRAHHRRSVLEAGLAEASRLLSLDTHAGYREAASKLEPLGALDPLGAASVRAFALGMLFADYRDAAAGEEADALLVAPGRAREVPLDAHLAQAAVALGRREAGNALTAAIRAGDRPAALALQARVALLAANVPAAEEPARAAAAAGLPAGLALHGDVLRRGGRDPAGARDAYERALAASPNHARAAFGLAKLAQAGTVRPAVAAEPLERLLADREGTPAPERGRAALHLAALRLRAGDRPGAQAALDAAGLDAKGRAWADRASAVLAAHRGPYRAVAGAPGSLQSASDDDPGLLAPIPPAPPAAKPTAKQAPARKATAAPTRRTTTTPKAKATSTRRTRR